MIDGQIQNTFEEEYQKAGAFVIKAMIVGFGLGVLISIGIYLYFTL